MSEQSKNKGCGCANIPLSVILLFLGGGFWWFKQNGLPDVDLNQINSLLAKVPGVELKIPGSEPAPPPTIPTPTPTLPPTAIATEPKLPPKTDQVETAKSNQPATIPQQVESQQPLPKTDWEKKEIRGIYLSRYQITNNASEQMIRDRVRYFDILPPRDVGDSQILDVAEVLGSASPLTLTTLRLLVQRWFSPQAFSPLQSRFRDALPYLRIRKIVLLCT